MITLVVCPILLVLSSPTEGIDGYPSELLLEARLGDVRMAVCWGPERKLMIPGNGTH